MIDLIVNGFRCPQSRVTRAPLLYHVQENLHRPRGNQVCVTSGPTFKAVAGKPTPSTWRLCIALNDTI